MPKTFTARVEADNADDLRAARDRTDAEVAAHHLHPTTADIALDRHQATTSRGFWEQQAAAAAVSEVLRAAIWDSLVPSTTHDGRTMSLATRDLDGASITVTINDLVAEATLTLPDD